MIPSLRAQTRGICHVDDPGDRDHGPELTGSGLGRLGAGREEDPVPSPGVLQVSAVEQSRRLDQNIPKVVAAMAESPEVHAKLADRLTAENAHPFPLTPVAEGLAPSALERWRRLRTRPPR